MANGRSVPSPSLSSKSNSPHSLGGVPPSSQQHSDRPLSGSSRDRDHEREREHHRRPTPTTSPLDAGNKDDVITGKTP